MKIMNNICDFKRQHLDISKVLKIFNYLKYVNNIIVRAFMDIYIYYQILIKIFAQVAAFIY